MSTVRSRLADSPIRVAYPFWLYSYSDYGLSPPAPAGGMDALEVPWNPGLNILAGIKCVLLLMPYEEFSVFIVSLYVSDLPTATKYRYRTVLYTVYVVFRAL